MALTFRQRFYCLVIIPESEDECYIWDGHLGAGGYGIFAGKRAHRVAWTLEHGEIPEGHMVRHYICDNPACVNVRHLRTGTAADNVRDMISKRRNRSRYDSPTFISKRTNLELQLRQELQARRKTRHDLR